MASGLVLAHAQLVVLPSAASTTGALETQSSSIFNEFVILVLVGAGIAIAGMALAYFVGAIRGAASRVFRGKKGGRRGRRR